MPEIQIVDKFISLADLTALAKLTFGDMVKAVIDLEQGVVALGAELHADEEALLLEKGSKQSDLWGFNIYVNQPQDSWLEFNSMVNIRPSQNNPSRDIQDEQVKARIKKIVKTLVK